jgi:DNA ligase (NAD+)
MTEEITQLVEDLKRYNAAYRKGRPLISDNKYDLLVERLRELDPQHPFLYVVEPEKFKAKKEIRHPSPMLSTEKAYTRDQLKRFIARVEKEAGEVGVPNILFKITPKLDGLAARDDGKILATRGNGVVGYEISNVFQKGITPLGGRGLGLGEIVVLKSYFSEHLMDKFEHPRNMVVGIVSSDVLNEFAKRALQDKAVIFVPSAKLPSWTGHANEMIENMEKIMTSLIDNTDYPTDGIIVEVMNEDVKNYMGATTHHYRWQIAVKTKGETAVTVVEDIIWQVGRTGNVTPVMKVRPVSLSGASIKRVTAHHAGLIQKKRIGINAEIEIIRSGEVIPKLERVIKDSQQVIIPSTCPSCGRTLEWNNEFLKCNNTSCKAQIEQRISHWFKTLGNADWFGIKTIKRLVENGYDTLEKIYAMEEKDFLALGFGPVQSKNLFNAIGESRSKAVEDWRFLSAFGIPDLGNGDSRKLLSHLTLEELLHETPKNIEKIDGFGAITSSSITKGIAEIKPTMDHMLSLGFNLERTPPLTDLHALESPIRGKGIVFTGKMAHGTREEMQTEARNLGANPQSAVSRKTDLLVCGDDVGSTKIHKARELGVRILTEMEYYEMLGNNPAKTPVSSP